MREPLPIVCTLTRTELQDRYAAWQKVLNSGLLDRSRVSGGVRLVAQPGAAEALLTLIGLERECCAWMRFEIAEPADVTITADSTDGEDVLARMFLPAGL